MVSKALKLIYGLILGYLLKEQSLAAFSFFNVEYLVLAVLSLLFFVGYMLYVVTEQQRFIILTVSSYFIYSSLSMWKTFLHPLISPQEYIAAIVIRHNVADKKYLANPADFLPLATLYVDGAHS